MLPTVGKADMEASAETAGVDENNPLGDTRELTLGDAVVDFVGNGVRVAEAHRVGPVLFVGLRVIVGLGVADLCGLAVDVDVPVTELVAVDVDEAVLEDVGELARVATGVVETDTGTLPVIGADAVAIADVVDDEEEVADGVDDEVDDALVDPLPLPVVDIINEGDATPLGVTVIELHTLVLADSVPDVLDVELTEALTETVGVSVDDALTDQLSTPEALRVEATDAVALSD